MAAITQPGRRWSSERGAELLELAIALPILMLIIGGVVDFAIMFQRYEVVTNAAREGARVAVLPDFATADIQSRVTSYLAASGLNRRRARTIGGVHVRGDAWRSVDRCCDGHRAVPTSILLLTPLAALVGGGPHANIMLKAASTMRLEIAAGP
jgi:hypothetical protein